MDGHPLLHVALQLIGWLLIVTILLDVFLAVLYARVGSGILSHRVACWTWVFFRRVSQPFRRRRDFILSLCGPIILVSVVSLWVIGLLLGSSLVIRPMLGTSIRALNGESIRSFPVALHIAAGYLSTSGANEYAPRSNSAWLFLTFDSFIGISVLTLTLTYILEIYNALQRRNTFALKLHLLTGETGDAAEFVAGLGPHDQFRTGYVHLTEVGAEMVAFTESHHFYSGLFYFRFMSPHYDVARVALVALDSITLIKSALDDEEYGWLKKSAAVEQVWRGSMQLVTVLAPQFLPQRFPYSNGEVDEETRAAWARRYRAAASRLREAGAKTFADEDAGAEIYIALRMRWDRYIKAFAKHMSEELVNIDRALYAPAAMELAPPFEQRLRIVS
jgi:hypothetical protein